MHLLGHSLHDQSWKTIGIRLLIGLCLLVVVVWFGRHAGGEIKSMESWIEGHGLWGRIAFVAVVVVFTSVFVPDTLLEIAAGVMFGLFWGTVLISVSAIITAALSYFIAGKLLRPRIDKLLENHPKLRAIARAANREGLRLQLLMRFSPLNQVLVSYAMATSGVRFTTFMTATVGMILPLFVGVYFGYVTSHVTKVAGKVSDHSTMHTVVTVGGFVVCLVLMIVITRLTTKALAEAESEPDSVPPRRDTSGAGPREASGS
jgi:uncharacterized membrane protein YdjX (TVP38/TMEM64 family)